MVPALVHSSASVLVVGEIEIVEVAGEWVQTVAVVEVEVGVEGKEPGTTCEIRFDPVAAETSSGARGQTGKLHQSIHFQPSPSTRNPKPMKPNCRANVEPGLRPGIALRTAYYA